MERLIFHVDVNSAFLSREATRRDSLGEENIRLIPSAIAGTVKSGLASFLPNPSLSRNSVLRPASQWPWHCESGSVAVYSHLQACGIINDHEPDVLDVQQTDPERKCNIHHRLEKTLN